MKKFILFAFTSLCLICNIQTAFAEQEIVTGEMLLDRIKTYRTDMYKTLELSNEQEQKINKIDEDFFNKTAPELDEISNYIVKLNNIANSSDCSKEKVDAVKKEFKVTEKKISKIKKEYNKEFNAVLTKQQKSRYKMAVKEKRALLKQEIKYLKLKQKNQWTKNNDKR